MGRLRLSRAQRAFVGCLLGIALGFVGLALVLGLGWALVAGGAGVALAFALLYDVDESPDAELARRRRRGIL